MSDLPLFRFSLLLSLLLGASTFGGSHALAQDEGAFGASSGDEEEEEGAFGADSAGDEEEEGGFGASSGGEDDEAEPQLYPPELEQFVEAEYPAAAREAGLEATVELVLTIAVDGVVTDAQVVTPRGNGFDEAALDAVRRFRFRPARRGDEAIAARVRYGYVFELREPEPDPLIPDAPPPGRLEGRVLAAEDGQPIGRAEVIVTSEDESIARRVVTDDSGTFRVDELPGGSYLVRITADEYGGLSSQEEIVSGEVTDLTLRLNVMTADTDNGAFGATARVDPPPREVTRRTIPREQLTSIPGTRGDALRAVEILPGVARPPFGGGALIVRGSAPQDSQTFFEGIPVPLLYHFGGLTSVVNSRLLNRIDFYPGNFSARYGRKIGGILDVGFRDPLSTSRDRGLHGVAELSVIDASLLAEFPLGEDGEAAFSFRRSFIDVVFNNVIPDDLLSVTAAPVYYDYQAFLTWRPTENDRLRLFGYGSSDRFEIIVPDSFGDDPEVSGSLGFTTRFNFAHLEWEHRVDERTEIDTDFQMGTTLLDFGLGQLISFQGRFNQIFMRSELRHRANDNVRLIMGFDSFSIPFTLNYRGPALDQQEGGTRGDSNLSGQETVFFSTQATAFRPAVYVETELTLGDVRLVPGLRLDYAREIDAFNFDPRISGFWQVTENFRLKAGAGLYSQPPEFQESAEGLGNPNLDWIHSLHTGFGFDWDVVEGFNVGLEGFFKYLWDRVVATPGGVPPRFDNAGIGRIYGMELSARLQPTEDRPFFGYLSYTLSRSERRDRPEEDWRLFDFDQTHIFTIAFSYRFPRNWEVGGTLRLVSGNPTTGFAGSVYDPNFDSHIGIPLMGPRGRNPLFNRLDIRIEKKWIFDNWRLALFLDIQNVYNQANQEGVLFSYDFRESVPVQGLPILPALGIRGEL